MERGIIIMSNFIRDIQNAVDRANSMGLGDFMFKDPRSKGRSSRKNDKKRRSTCSTKRCTSRKRSTCGTKRRSSKKRSTRNTQRRSCWKRSSTRGTQRRSSRNRKSTGCKKRNTCRKRCSSHKRGCHGSGSIKFKKKWKWSF
ncbi:CotG/ExsB N-terminal domain-containing protein [Peribacillus simplex]|uniref:CotG/ExsB N-terminal domain-containing protein n=1 Tax=Peribacillus TaxID=2675229 RepID=UPI0037CC2CE3